MFQDVDDTIAAISSAVGPATRMIVRMSGPFAHAIARQLCRLGETDRAASPTYLTFNGMSIPAWVYAFSAPRSYTSQDLVEFHIPGNPLLARLLLTELANRGARHAEAGEFTARAYFAGRMDLTEAEGVAATISARGEAELRAARQLLAGELSRRLAPAMELLAQTLALVEVGIDFSDEDVTFLPSQQAIECIDQADAMLAGLVAQSARFERLSHEPTFILAGRPNAGKSTLLNALAGHARAVVSDVSGTTRDVVSAEVHLSRGLARVIDVAGLGDESTGEIDQKMADQARRALETADFVLLIRDAGDHRPALDLSRRPDLILQSKSDLTGGKPSATGLAISAKTGQGMDGLRNRLDMLAFGSEATGSTLALNARHLQAIDEARAALARSRATIDAGAELLALELREALDALGRVLGRVTPDDLLGRVFSAFCIGK